jgi:hypothetical protein
MCAGAISSGEEPDGRAAVVEFCATVEAVIYVSLSFLIFHFGWVSGLAAGYQMLNEELGNGKWKRRNKVSTTDRKC